MRTIKFRAWDYESKTMLSAESLAPRIDEAIYGWDKDESATSLEPMQFTGLLDKNGKEIYEGDIVKIEGSYDNTIFPGIITDVSFIIGVFRLGNSLRISDLLGNIHDLCEVIGNIYENPDLLKP